MKKKSKGRNKFEVIISFVLIVLIAGFSVSLIFGKDKEKDDDTNIDSPTAVKKLQIVDEESKTRPIAVMVNNNHVAWKHAGLQDAYLVYEMIVEGGITRMMAIFKDQDTAKIGSVRSSRHYFLDYALENDAIYVHFGWSPQAESDISSLNIANVNFLVDSGSWRDTSLNKPSEHTAFTSMEKLDAVIKNKGYKTETSKKMLLNYSVDEINLNEMNEVSKADVVDIVYSTYQTTRYEYDAINKVYKRSMSDSGTMTKHVDAVTDKQYTVKNIITYKVSNYSIDSYGRQDLENIGSGSGYYITNGYAVPITWEKASRSGQTIYKYLSGEEIKVNDGNTFIQIQPTGQKLEIKENS